MAAKRGSRQPTRQRTPAGGGKKRRRSGSRRKNRPTLQAVLWFAGGLAIGLAILLPILLLSGERQPADPEPASEPASPADRIPEPPSEDSPQEAEPRPEDSASDEDSGYRFYTLLPEMEVEVPEEAPESPGPEPQSTGEPPSSEEPPSTETAPPEPEPPRRTEDGRFLLQVSAFREPEAAEKLKARLAMQGLRARVVRADLGDKGVWHRVRLGPYAAEEEAEEVHDRLKAKGMEAMILRK